MKTCSKCKEISPLSEFRRDRRNKDGLQGYCKSCDKAYQQSERGKAVRHKAIAKYQRTPKGKAANRRAIAKHNALNPNYAKATNAVNRAIKTGKLISPKFLLCHYCSKPAQQYHHWKGYAPERWLDVIPVCKECHYKCKKKIA